MRKTFIIIFIFTVFILSLPVIAGHQGGIIQEACTNCHTPNLINQHGGFNSLVCWRCHASEDPVVKATIEAGSMGQPVYCYNCHGTAQHRDKHISSYIPYWFNYPGVEPGPSELWTQPTTFTIYNPASKQYQVCLKCHSYYTFGNLPDGVTNYVTSSGVNLTDQAMEFNPSNKAAHPVIVPLNNMSGSYAPRSLTTSQMRLPFTNVGNQTVLCSDCHGISATGMISKYMLVGDYSWPMRPDTNKFWTLGDIKNNQGTGRRGCSVQSVIPFRVAEDS